MFKEVHKRWYIIQVFSGSEKRVVFLLKEYIKSQKLQNFFGKILVPVEEVVEVKSGCRKKSERKFFPGYILIEMVMNKRNWHLIKNIPKVAGFIGGSSDSPIAVSNYEIDLIMNRLKEVEGKIRPKILFEPGEVIRVINGPFSEFTGVVEKVDYEKNRLKVSVSIFGRSTPVDLSFNQIEKI